jgi:hypothetical protein
LMARLMAPQKSTQAQRSLCHKQACTETMLQINSLSSVTNEPASKTVLHEKAMVPSFLVICRRYSHLHRARRKLSSQTIGVVTDHK